MTIDIGTIVEYGLDSFGEKPATYRVSSWLRIAQRPKFNETPENINELIDEVLFDSCQKINGNRMQWCLQHEATHVGLTGIAGRIAPIEECKIIGIVDWPKEHIEDERKHAIALGERHEMLF